LINLAQVAIEQGDLEGAEPLIEEAIGLFEAAGGDSYGTAQAHLTRADLAQRRGDVEEAERANQEALHLGRHMDDKPLVAITLIALGEMARARGDQIEALKAYREVLTLDSDLGDKLRVAVALDGLAALAEARGEAAPAARLLGAADRLHRVTGIQLLPGKEEARERVMAALIEALGEGAVAAREAGRALPLEAAAAEALALADEFLIAADA
jgi:tetratricopeptide (TPR) repeat protein